jgi:hypothetical protein
VKQVDELNPEKKRDLARIRKAHPCGDCDRKPSICANVIFFHPADKMGINLLKSPAIIQSVNDDETVNLVFFSVAGNTSFRLSVAQGQKLYQWDWPENVDTEK